MTLDRIPRPPKDLSSFIGRKWLESLSVQNESLNEVTNLEFLVLTLDSRLTNARRLTGSSDITLTDLGAGNDLILALSTSGVSAGTYTKLTVDSKGRVTSATLATTSDVSEGSNLYFTDARVLSALPQDIDTTDSPTFADIFISNLTPTRVVFVTTSGQLTDDADLTFNGTTLSSNKVAIKAGSSSGNIAKSGGVVFDYYTDVQNSGTSETDLYSSTLPADIFASNGDKVTAQYGGFFVSSATATRRIKVYFAGTAILDTSTLITASAETWSITVSLIRVSSSVIRYIATLQTSDSSIQVFNEVGELTGLTLSGTNILKITGQAGGVGAATGDITSQLGYVEWKSAA